MLIEKIALDRIKTKNWVETLSTLEIGDSVFATDSREAESIRVSSYYLIRTRGLPWKFVSRKMDRGWRIIRVL